MTDIKETVAMKVMIVGLGSMGKRRARLLKGILPDVCLLGVDSAPARRAEAEALGFTTYETLAAGIAAAPDAAFVCTAPISHAGIIRELLQGGIPVFTELNLIDDGYDELQALAAEKNVPLFLSSTMLWRGETRYIRDSVREFAKPVSYIYHIGQYLPDWHPWESYKNFFVGNKRTNGCREIFGIEMPWLIEAFGKVTDVYSVSNKVTDLDIDFDDRYFVTLTHESGARGVLSVDVVCPKAVRNLEVYGEGLHLFW
jgi:predicted dehydrogenase